MEGFKYIYDGFIQIRSSFYINMHFEVDGLYFNNLLHVVDVIGIHYQSNHKIQVLCLNVDSNPLVLYSRISL